jgi:HD-GYP domain-containing protein (c-di-GMP phosphodiesterase class II)
MKVRFHLLPTVLLATFVVVLTSVTIFVSMTKFKSLADESTQTVFSLIAQRNAEQLQTIVADAGTAVQAQSALEPSRILVDGHLNEAALVPALVATLRMNPHLYSLYYGFENGLFLQVIGVRGDPRIVSVLHAPAGAYFAVRLIDPTSAGRLPRREHWQFLASNETPVGPSSLRHATYIPHLRPWYRGAMATSDVYITEPYLYDSLRGMGLSLAHALPNGLGVFGADISLDGFSGYAAASLGTRAGGIVVTDDRGTVLASHATGRFGTPRQDILQLVTRSDNPLFAEAGAVLHKDGSSINLVHGEAFAYASRSVVIAPGAALHVVAFSPMSLYTGAINAARNGIVLFAGMLLVVFLPLTEIVARRIAGALGSLSSESERIQRLDFSGEQAVRSVFYEIDALGAAQHTMKTAIRERTEALDTALARLESLLESGTRLASRRSPDTVMQQVLESARQVINAGSGQFWLCTDYGTLRLAAHSHEGEMKMLTQELVHEIEIPVAAAPMDPCAWAVIHGRSLRLDSASTGHDLAAQHALLGGNPVTLLAVPVLARGDKPIGVLLLANAGHPGIESGDALFATAFGPDLVRYAETLAAQAGVALENIALFDAQRLLMESMLQLLAGAIDAKSAYTGSHCARVPELARMLAEAACEVDSGPLASFRFETEAEWREFRIGTWLHDAGKITTPEHVVDKATKLETIFNRIHEIRTRFEVLLRDAEIERLNAVITGADPAASRQVFEARRAQLQEDFAFVAQCNIGAESMAPEHAERLRTIARQTWMRHYDDRLGLSHGEESRFAGSPPGPLPVVEQLLADKPEHIVPRTDEQRYDARFGFRMDVPEHLYNFGEVHNLSVSRGTLTPEERYKINEHIIQTIVMLDQLPLPPELKRVPEYAGTHHETLTGTGYPRRLAADALSVPARIMAIADIFEALTASDRPYKKAKPLSEAVRILSSFKARKHIDADLFDLFLTSGVYQRYAEIYLPPEQIDEVDVTAYVDAEVNPV